MMARWYAGVLALVALLLLVVMAAALGGGVAAVVSAGAFLALFALCAVAILYALARRYAAAFPPAGGERHKTTWRCACEEVAALFVAFVIVQPFERLWMGSDAVGPLAPGRTPVLLVHGYLCNRGLWRRLRRRLRARGLAVATINLEPPLAGMDELAKRLGERIEALIAETGAEKVALVTHSMGGLVARAYLSRHGASRVARLVTLAAPHHGTQEARLGRGSNAREMRPDSEWLRRLDAEPAPPIPFANIWSLDDEVVAPADSSRLAGARETMLSGLGHIAMTLSPKALALVEAELTEG